MPFSTRFLAETRRGYRGISNQTEIGDASAGGLRAVVKTFVAGKVVNRNWSAAGRSGSASVDLLMELDAVVRVGTMKKATDPGICVDARSTSGLRYHIGSFRIPTAVPGTFLEIPVCIALQAEANLSAELLRYRRTWHLVLHRDGSAPPTATLTTLDSDAPAGRIDERIDATSAAIGPAVDLTLGAFLETGLQISHLAIVGYGGQVQVGAVAKGRFDAGPTFRAGTWQEADTFVDLCLRVKTDWQASVTAFAAFLGRSQASVDLIKATEGIRDYAIGFGPACGLEVQIDPTGSFGPVGSLDLAVPATTLALAQVPAFFTGQQVEIRVTGRFAFNGNGATGAGASAVFRDAAGVRLRPDFATGVNTGLYATPPCMGGAGTQAADVPEDFGLSDVLTVRILPPVGAVTLALSTGDCFFRDNRQGVPALTAHVRRASA